MDKKALYKSDEGSVLGGVCKGVSELYNWDVSMVRLITLLLIFAAGVPVIVYLIMWIVLPEKKNVVIHEDPKDDYTIDDDDYFYD